MNRLFSNFGVRRRVLLAGYSAALGLALAGSAPWWAGEMKRGGKYREGWRERLGRIPRERLRAPKPEQTAVWIHAVSVGEVLAAGPLVAQLRAALPGARVYVSTTTLTGQAIARARFGADSVFYFPADFAFAVRAWLRYLRPSVVVLVESEFWPRMLDECARRGIPVAVVNARVSDRSWPRYRRLRRVWRPLLRTLALALAQTEVDAERLRLLGAQRVEVAGNLKYDVPRPQATALCELLQSALPAGVPVVVCGSTLSGEEELLLHALPREPIIVLAPRHPDRFAAVTSLLNRSNRPWLRLSAWRLNPEPTAPGSVLLLDSIGELAALYALATVAIVGGSFFEGGGHNPLEPAALGKPVVVGPSYANFTEIVESLRRPDALVIAQSTELREKVEFLLAHPAETSVMGERARAVCAQNSGATARTVAALVALIAGGSLRESA